MNALTVSEILVYLAYVIIELLCACEPFMICSVSTFGHAVMIWFSDYAVFIYLYSSDYTVFNINNSYFRCYFSREHIALSFYKNGVNMELGKTNRLKALCMIQNNT